MNVALRKAMTVDEFLAWEDRQELRYEFDGTQPVAMVGGTIRHSTIQANLIRALGNALRGGPCRVHGSHLKIQAGSSIRYPDAFVLCEAMSGTAKVVTLPIAVFEILSPSNVGRDVITKNAEYRQTPSIRRYVILQQTAAEAMIFARHGDDWLPELVSGLDGIVRLPEIGAELSMQDLYDGVEFEEDDAI